MKAIQLTDTHIYGNPDTLLAGVNTRNTFSHVLNNVARESNIKLLILTGDISMDGSAASYAWVQKQLDDLGVRYFVIPGNHDVIGNWDSRFGRREEFFPFFQDYGNWRFVFLNTQSLGNEFGEMSSVSIQKLSNILTTTKASHSALFMHHPPFRIGCAWIDKIGLADGRVDFLNLVKSHASLRLIVAGHVHQESDLCKNGYKFVTSPSTCVQFAPGSDEFKIGLESPGYRIFNFSDDGKVDTEVKRVPLE